MIASNNKFQSDFKEYLRQALALIGPKSFFPPNETMYTFTEGELGGIVYRPEFISMSFDFNEKIFSGLPKVKSLVNNTTLYEILKRIVISVAIRIKVRSHEIKETFGERLTADDMRYAETEFLKILNVSNRTHKVWCVTNLIELENVDKVVIGRVDLQKINATTICHFPEAVPQVPALRIFDSEPRILSRKEYFENKSEHILLSVDIEGIHVGDESSLVYEQAVSEFKLVFAYLSCSRFFLITTSKSRKPLAVKKIESMSNLFSRLASSQAYGQQEYFVMSGETFKRIDLSGGAKRIAKEIFVISDANLEDIQEGYFLNVFNQICRDSGGVKDKILRSFEWLYKGLLEDDSTNQIIAWFISLEALLSLDPNPLSSHLNEISENLAMLRTFKVEERIAYKKEFKEAYNLRCKIMHHGQSRADDDTEIVYNLLVAVSWGLRGMILRYNYMVSKFGKTIEDMRRFFEAERLGPGTKYEELKALFPKA